jgi:ABC-2 type transport system permease protein
MQTYLLKWWQTIRISWSKYTAYRLNFFLQVIGPFLVFFFIKYNLWSSIYEGSTTQVIKGYDFQEMMQYHIWTLIISLLGQGYAAMNLSEDIRLGRISSYLIYPFEFWEFHTAGFVSFQILQVFVSSVTLCLAVFFRFIEFPSFSILLSGFCFTLFMGFFWFTLQYFTGLLAFWLEETWIMRVLVSIIVSFLSGYIFPLELYPEWLVSGLKYTPFPYMSYFPAKIFMGQEVNLTLGYSVLTFWIAVFAFINHSIWKKGMRLYTAAGM